MIGDYEDDTHFCLKCHITILGLDNYVSHRKSGCSKSVVVEAPKSPLPSQLLPPDESFSLKADDFFSSLELQSSSKKPPATSTTGKSFSGIRTRSKTTAVSQASSSVKDSNERQSKSGKHVWIGGQELKLGHGDNQSKLIKAVANLERRKEDLPKVDTYDESEVDSDEYDYDDDESSEDDSEHPPRNHTGGKWKPSSPVHWGRSQEWNHPPPNFTGGKWKPGTKRMSPPPTHTKGKWKPESTKDDDDIPPPTFTGSKWVPSKKQTYQNVPPSNYTKGKWKPKSDDYYPPPSHTKGKWKPVENEIEYTSDQNKTSKVNKDDNFIDVVDTREKFKDLNEDLLKDKQKYQRDSLNKDKIIINQPTPNYTKGKWKPTENAKKADVKITDDSLLRKSSGTVQYWCRPCNRRLASKIVYERHLKSELHFKRTLNDRDFDETEYENIVSTKRSNKNTLGMLYDQEFKTKEKKVKRKRKTIYEKCLVCNSKVNKCLIGKHLISHYHWRRSDIRKEEAKSMILKNIKEVVMQSPFQCNVCKFYCNTHDDFLNHWLSDMHNKRDLEVEGYYYCSLCKYKSDNTNLMYQHFLSNEHNEVVLVINRSVPIIIKKINSVYCITCNQSFLLHIQLLKHCEKYQHDSKNVNVVKYDFICTKCKERFSTSMSLQRHKRNVHKETYFICSVCNMTFNDLSKVQEHRKSAEHRYASLKNQEKDQELKRKCGFCDIYFENVLKLKDHMNSEHPEHKIKCPHCGESFTVPQELTTHLRIKGCKFNEKKEDKNMLSCDKCLYTTNSTSELLYHKVLHNEPLILEHNSPDKKPVIQYKCPICQKFYPKSSLLGHLRIHTKERPFVCKTCNASFVRKNNLIAHMKIHTKKDTTVVEKKKIVGVDKSFLCSTCGASFSKKSILQQHMAIHNGKKYKCPEPGCIFVGRKMADIKYHLQRHSDEKNFSCELCKYKGKSKQQLQRHLKIHTGEKKYKCNLCSFNSRISSHLKRHMRLHTGAKPFSCPHCDYRCNTLDNLRKHVLSTKKHTGKCLYECKFCNEEHFHTNLANKFKEHLVTIHSDMFPNGAKAASYVSGIYDIQDDSIVPNESSTDKQKYKTKIEYDPTEENMLQLVNRDPLVTQTCNVDMPSTSTTEAEMLPMFVISKDDIIFVDKDSWNLSGQTDHEESTALAFENDDSNSLFEEPF